MSDRHLDELEKTIQLATEVYILHKDKVLMHKRAENKEKFPGFWIGPGGHINSEEDALTSAIREVKEETGVTLTPTNLKLKAIALHRHLDRKELWVSFVFLARIPTQQEIIHEMEEGSSKWIDLKELQNLKNVFPPSSYYFDHVLNDSPGVLYANSEWENSLLVRELNRKVDGDY
jgi:8-oxo-dGTP pyrophosphatase MutT (NUDIX family)